MHVRFIELEVELKVEVERSNRPVVATFSSNIIDDA